MSGPVMIPGMHTPSGPQAPEGAGGYMGQGFVNKVVEGVKDVGSSLAEGASSAWDVLSGERDWRRSKAAAEEARNWTAEREDTAIIRTMDQLKQAGINPMLAGQIGPAGSSASPVPTSHSASSWHSTLGLAGGLVKGGVDAVQGMANVGLIRANSAKSLAETASTLRRIDPDIARIMAATALDQARVPEVKAHTAESVSRTQMNRTRHKQMKYELPRFAAEHEYYKKYGRNAILARENKNPWQSSMLVGGQVGDGLQFAVPKLNSAAAVLAAQAAKKIDRNVRPRARARSGSGPSYFNPGGR